jgi:hypothetical protein
MPVVLNTCKYNFFFWNHYDVSQRTKKKNLSVSLFETERTIWPPTPPNSFVIIFNPCLIFFFLS